MCACVCVCVCVCVCFLLSGTVHVIGVGASNDSNWVRCF